MVPIAGVIAELKANTTTASVVGTRVYDRDIRMDGEFATPDAFDTNRMVLPSLAVLDEGGLSNPYGAAIGVGGISVLVVTPGTDAGWELVVDLGLRVITVLEGWQDGIAGATLRYAGRLGRRRIDGESRDRLTFQVSSVLPTARW